ncbi:hypothetical protein ACPCUF_23970 [Streptomyces griseoincarnatus]
MKREVLLAEARKHVWAAWQLSAEELASQAVATLHGLGMLVPEGGAQELEKLAKRVAELEVDLAAKGQDTEAAVKGWERCRSSLKDATEEIARLESDLGGATARVAELEARHAKVTSLRDAALHDLPPGTQWRVIATDSESLTGLAPVCTADRRFHEIADYPGGPKYDDEGVYDCCPWPQIETYSVAVAAYLVALLNADAAKGGGA